MTPESPASRSLTALFHSCVDSEQSAAALIDGDSGAVTTRSQLRDRAARITAHLRSQGLKSGDFIAVQLPNSVDLVSIFIASLELGLTFVPIDRDARESEVAAILNHFAVRALVYRSRQTATEELPAVSIREVTPLANDGVPIALLKLSSGSTGLPKGIRTTEANLIADATNICSTMGIKPHDVNLGAIPFSHSYGFSNLVTPLLIQGTAVVVSNDYLPLSILGMANRFRCSVVPGIPMMYEHLAQMPRQDGSFEATRTFISAGAPLPGQVSSRFRDRFGIPVHTFYGCSECGGIAYDRDGGAVERGTVGKAMDNVALVLDGRHHRLSVRSDAVAAGYLLASPEENQRFVGGQFTTDDLGHLDGQSELVMTGRVGELINTAGKKVNPREVESIISQLAGVRQVKVYGEPAGARGEVVAAAVVADPDVSREKIREHCRAHLSAHKVPRIVKLIEQIPVDERGKVKRSVLAEL